MKLSWNTFENDFAKPLHKGLLFWLEFVGLFFSVKFSILFTNESVLACLRYFNEFVLLIVDSVSVLESILQGFRGHGGPTELSQSSRPELDPLVPSDLEHEPPFILTLTPIPPNDESSLHLSSTASIDFDECSFLVPTFDAIIDGLSTELLLIFVTGVLLSLCKPNLCSFATFAVLT